MRRTGSILTALGAAFLLSTAAHAAIPGQDPDWPCQQRLVPKVTAALFWSGDLPADGDWHADTRVSKLVDEIGSRDVTVDEATPKIVAFAKGLPPDARKKFLPLAFEGVIDVSNNERTQVIGRIEALTRRQRDLVGLVDKVSGEVDAIPADATGDQAAKRAEAVQRKDFLTRTFEETQRTMRYACEVPAELDSRLGGLARTMQNNM